MTPVILRGALAVGSPHAGGKARALARAERAGLAVPPWFVVSSVAFAHSLASDQRAAVDAATAAVDVAGALGALSVAPVVAASIVEAVRELAPDGALLAVRSSAGDEDGAEHSFAGQLESYLNVPPEAVVDRVLDVWRSAFTERIGAYRRERGLTGPPSAPAVLVQRMVAPRAAGVAFGADPVTGRRARAIVSAVAGFGSAVVSGEAETDTWVVDRDGTIVERRIVGKRRMHIADSAAPGGVRAVDVPGDLANRPALSDDEVLAVASLVREAGRHFGRPQDIEWAIADRLFLLQSRPITSLRAMADPDARRRIWDNSNIVESYSGVTTPLTFSFVREIYAHVYRQFCRMMGVPERVIEAEDETFVNMLGLVRGRLFYNLLNWYRLLAMLPGYRLNRRFMEQMMGVREALPEPLAVRVGETVRRGRARDAAYTIRTVARLLANHVTLDRRVDAFYARLDAALRAPVPPLEDRRVDELVEHYRDLRTRLLLRWDAPIVNDFFAMVFYGLLRRLVTRWCGDPDGTLQNDLLGGENGIVSAEPAVRMQRMARLAVGRPGLGDVLRRGPLDEIRRALGQQPELANECEAYLARFGDRTVNELKLETTTLHDDPLPLFRAIGTLAAQLAPVSGHESPDGVSPADRLRADSRERVRTSLAGRPLRRTVFAWVLHHARRRVRDRENLRLERTRLFGRVRRIFLEIGRRLAALGLLDDPRDVFFLEVDEVLAFAEGRATTTDLKALTALRKAEFRGHAGAPPPADRFETSGPLYHGHDFRSSGPDVAPEGSESRKGLGCSPGVVRGPVRIVTDPTSVNLGQHEILVAEHTDPGWIMVFPSARAVLVERGSLLSHAAIVARELGIPAVVSLPGVTDWLHDGDWIEMNGSTGVVRRIPPPADVHA